jgi:hypothetical protein
MAVEKRKMLIKTTYLKKRIFITNEKYRKIRTRLLN